MLSEALNLKPEANPVRLTASQIDTIRRTVREEAGNEVVIRLFGSRIDDAARGGDIDLLVETTLPIDNPALFSARISGRRIRAFGGRRVDVVLSAPNLQRLPIHDIAESEGILL